MTITKYTLGGNYCDCHPETCNCADYMIFKNKEKYAPVNRKEVGEHIVECLNFFEKNKNLVNKLKVK
jgi:hypothetical protein